MKQFYVFNRVFLLLTLLVGFVSCDKDENDVTPPAVNKYLVEVTTEQRISRTDIIAGLEASLGIQIANKPLALMIKDLDAAAITYNTTGVDGKPIVASGVVVMPVGITEYNYLLSIQHGTLDMEEAPSRGLFYYEMAPVVSGHVVVMADYLGYGVSQTPDRQHPYLHNESTGRVCADMIEAAREYLAGKRLKEKADKVDLIGYSQGANSTLATVYEMEKRGQSARIRAVHAGGGSYDLTGTLTSFLSNGMSDYPRMGYIPYIIRGMSYGEQITLDDAKVYSPALITKGLTGMFSTKPLSQWHEALGTDITQVIHPDFFAFPTFNGNTEIAKLLAAVEKNSLVKRDAPQTAVKLYHSRQDDFVPYSNATAAKAKWSNATLTDLTTPGHAQAGMEFMLRYMGLWEMFSGNSSTE